jgi:putative transposase
MAVRATCGMRNGRAGAADPQGVAGRRPRKTDMRAAMNAILYLLRTGCPWRYLPRDGFPPRSTVYNIFRKFQREGIWEAIWAEA